jgi:hypothetical protein
MDSVELWRRSRRPLVDLQTGASCPAGEETRPCFRVPGASSVPRLRAGGARASAHAFAVNQRLARSVNIIGYDPIWQDRAKGRFQEKHFARIREAGFDSVRINLHPFRHMDAANGFALKPRGSTRRLGGEGGPGEPSRGRPRHARVRGHGRGPGRPEGSLALLLAAGGAPLQGRLRRRRLRAAERALRQAHSRAVDRAPEGGPRGRPGHEPHAR